MEEEKKTKTGVFPKKENIIFAVGGLVVGIVLTCLVAFFMDYFAKSAGMARLKFGSDTVATVDGKAVTAEDIYITAKVTDGLALTIDKVDKLLISDMYTLTEGEEEEVSELAQYYITYNTSLGYSQQEFLDAYGFENYEEFLEDVKIRKKLDKYYYDYLEKKLEDGAVKKYYDENKDDVETYKSEHILVRVTDEVTDEQALELANEIIAKLNEGKTFDDVVQEYGDRITHENLGFQGKNSDIEDSYIDELVALEDGKYSQTPIKTSYGYHIVHKLKTATLDDLRPSIIEILAKDIIEADDNLKYKAYVELRKEKNLTIFDEKINKQYEDYCKTLYGEE